MKQTNISIFIPHIGCPHKCSFCDQRTISGTQKPPRAEDVTALLDEQAPHLSERGITAEIAFFGGSFTAIPHDYMLELLKAAKSAVERHSCYTGIRCSTRPDCIDEQTLALLKEYGMTAIELGAQSMSDEVLAAHERCLYTADEFIGLSPATVRVYPTVILKNTRLGELFERGEYKSFSFEETIDLCAELLRKFTRNNIRVIRMGLHASADVERDMLGGVYHPALRETVESRIILNDLKERFSALEKGNYRVYTDPKNISKVKGQKKCNVKALSELGYNIDVLPLEGEYLLIK